MIDTQRQRHGKVGDVRERQDREGKKEGAGEGERERGRERERVS